MGKKCEIMKLFFFYFKILSKTIDCLKQKIIVVHCRVYNIYKSKA